MFTSSEEVLRFIKDEVIEFVDVRFTDLPGQQQHFNVPAAGLTADFFSEGVMFDGSSIRGFAAIHKSDMKLIPDPATAFVDPFRVAKTLNMNFSILEPRTGEPYEICTSGGDEGGGIPQVHRHRRHGRLRPRS